MEPLVPPQLARCWRRSPDATATRSAGARGTGGATTLSPSFVFLSSVFHSNMPLDLSLFTFPCVMPRTSAEGEIAPSQSLLDIDGLEQHKAASTGTVDHNLKRPYHTTSKFALQ
jgi:hypothetical protein